MSGVFGFEKLLGVQGGAAGAVLGVSLEEFVASVV